MRDYMWTSETTTEFVTRKPEPENRPEPKPMPPLKKFSVHANGVDKDVFGHQMFTGTGEDGPLRILKFHASKWTWDGCRWVHTWETEVVARFVHYSWVTVDEVDVQQ